VSVIIGVDAGGSTIDCVVDGAEAPVRGTGGANVRTLGVEAAAERIAHAIRVTIDTAKPDAFAVGAAGVGDGETARALEAALQTRFPACAIAVYDDAAIALRAAVPDGDGIVLIAGTGSIAYAQIGGAMHRAGGYGWMFGDDGSGFAIGRAALAQLVRSYDARIPREPLFEAIETYLGARDAQAVLARVYGDADAIACVAALAPLVLERAGSGERLASKIVQAAALELFDVLKALLKSAGIADRELPLVLSGGLLRANSLLTFLIETRLASDMPLLHPLKSTPLPVYGALELARRLRR
jgi:glucosamine kinase